MKKLLIYHIVLFTVLSCSEAEREMFDPSLSAIHFDLTKLDTNLIVRGDTLTYSFAFNPTTVQSYTLNIPVEIIGFRSEHDRQYRIELLSDIITAKPNTHYQSLPDYHVLPAQKGKDSLQIILFRHTDLQKSAKSIELQLIPSTDFNVGSIEKQHVYLRFSDILEEPIWWDLWKDEFGPYHRIKYQEWIRIWGDRGDISGFRPGKWNSPQVYVKLMDLKSYFENNPRYADENNPSDRGDRLTIPAV